MSILPDDIRFHLAVMTAVITDGTMSLPTALTLFILLLPPPHA
jgi:hypothetical protein